MNGNDGGQYWQDGENRECEIPADPSHKVRSFSTFYAVESTVKTLVSQFSRQFLMDTVESTVKTLSSLIKILSSP
eukprot:3512019-Pyramimonas_sp.AAC.1